MQFKNLLRIFYSVFRESNKFINFVFSCTCLSKIIEIIIEYKFMGETKASMGGRR